MDSHEHPQVHGDSDAALDFVRFCHRRRRVGWPELYDEMCAVASRGIYRGWGFRELGDHGIAFGLTEMPGLARLVAVVAAEEIERRGRILVGVMDQPPVQIRTSDEPVGDIRQPQILVGAAG
jgi:hypothetical protein